jgi:hypothetical protein
MVLILTSGSFLWLWACFKWLLLNRISLATHELTLLTAWTVCFLGSLVAIVAWLARGVRSGFRYLPLAVLGFALLAGW